MQKNIASRCIFRISIGRFSVRAVIRKRFVIKRDLR